MKTFKQLLKDELKEKNIPVEVSKLVNGRIKNTAGYVVSVKNGKEQNGIRIERETYKMYQSCTGKRDKVERITITLNGYANEKEMKEIVEQLKADYKPHLYNSEIKKLEVCIYNN